MDLKLSDATKRRGVRVRTLNRLIDSSLLRNVSRTAYGHPLLPEESVPTCEQCRVLIQGQPEQHLARAAKLIDRMQVEIEVGIESDYENYDFDAVIDGLLGGKLPELP
jgi:hypothetical protein